MIIGSNALPFLAMVNSALAGKANPKITNPESERAILSFTAHQPPFTNILNSLALG
jgi:hypothetical protein